MVESLRYQQNASVSETAVDEEMFLVELATQEVFYLDTIGAALWRLIAEPRTIGDIVALYSAAFPDAGRSTIEHDIEVALQDLLDRNLAIAVP